VTWRSRSLSPRASVNTSVSRKGVLV
jgi:hypothetical protein